jgi:hypothetical protein
MSQETVISLESYAAVLAGLGAGLDLARALAHAGVLPAEWDRASEHWQSQIDESAASDLSLLVAFDAALLAARRRFEPTAEPIESDLRAWAHFRRHFVTAVDPIAFLAEHGLSLASYARIEAEWTNRTLADRALAEALREHLAAPLEECPALTLIPSPLLLTKAPGQKCEASTQPREAPLEDRPVVPPPPIIPPTPPSLELPLSEETRLPLDDGAMERSFSSSPVPAFVPEAPLPFRSEQGDAGAMDPVETVTTAVAPLSYQAPALPFRAEGLSQAGSAREVHPVAPSDAGRTRAAPLVAKRAALPFRPSPSSHEHRVHPATPTPAPEPAPEESSTGTVVAPALPTAPAMPFRSSAMEPGPAPPSSMPNVDPTHGAGGQRASASPLSSTATSSRSDLALASAQPDEPSETVLSLSQYASLCAELAVFPWAAEGIFRRYGLETPQHRHAVDAVWKERLQRDREQHQAWQAMYRQYRDYWTKHRMQGP